MSHDEPAGPGDAYRDFCLWDYAPVAAPEGKLRAAGLLWEALEHMRAPPFFAEALHALREALGQGAVVWGLKHAAGTVSLELYFYDYARLERQVSIERILQILSPWIACDVTPPPGCPYFMVSLDLDAQVAASRRIPALNVYLGNPGSSVSSGMSCEVTGQGIELRNIYNFFDANNEGTAIRRKIVESARLDLRHYRHDMLLWPEMAGCRTVVVANKRVADGLYYTRLRVGQLLWFLRRTGFPAPLIAGIESRRDRLDHLLFDGGFDFCMAGGRMEILKSAYYALF